MRKLRLLKLRFPKLPAVNWYALEIVAALGLLAVGIGMLSVPAALITLGVLFLADAVWGAAKG